MGLLTNRTGSEVVKAREFDITQYGKWMAGLIGVLTPAIVGALRLFNVDQVTPAMVIAALAVTAVAIFSASLVIAVDMLARAMVTRPQPNPAPQTPPNDAAPEPGEEVRVKTKETRVSRG